MKCIYCEASETCGVLLCYGCQVDLFPLVSSWAYCGVCGNELPTDTAICAPCAQVEARPIPSATLASVAPASASSGPAWQRRDPSLPSPSKASVAPSPKPESLPKARPVTREEIKKARRLQLAIRSVFAIFWLVIVTLVLLWARELVNQPIPLIVP